MSHIAMAESLLNAGNVTAAYRFLQDIPQASVERDFLIGKCCTKLGDVPAAVAAYTSVLARDPKHAAAASALGAVYVHMGWHDKADALYTKTLKKNDDDKLRVEYGVLLWSRNQQSRALTEIGKVIARNPKHMAARLQRGIMLMSLDRGAEAAEDLRFVAATYPDNPEPLSSLGTLEFRLGNYEAAVGYLQRACRHQPRDGDALSTLAISQMLAGRLDESRESLKKLREVAPERWQDIVSSTRLTQGEGTADDFDPRPIFLLLSFQEQMRCDWSQRAAYEQVFRELIQDPRNSNPGILAHCSGIAPLTLDERRQLMRHAADLAAAGTTPYRHEPRPTPEKMRIGYILPHLGDQVVANIMLKLMEAHDPATTALHIFSTTQLERDYASGKAERYQAAIPGLRYTDLTPLSDAEAAARIHAQELDVLVDLAVYNDHARPGIVARRPAPVQVNFLGAPFTSGADWIDYIITDPVVNPTQEGWCTEAEACMPSCYFVYGHEDATPPEVPPRTAFGLPGDRFLFSGLNNPYKIDPQTFEVWMRILTATPGSLLLLKAGEEIQKNLKAQAVHHGVDPTRLLFAPRLDSDRDYLLRQGSPDLFLDTRYYGAHTTMAESLWMGTPALSCPGDSFQSRVGASLLSTCGLPELIAPDWAAYEELAVALFHDRPRLQALRVRLAQTRLAAAPFDMAGQARALEKAFRHMRQRFAEGLAPASFKVAELPE